MRRYLSRVVIYSPSEDVQYYFICDAWLAVDIGDCVLDKTFNAATESQVKEFQHLFPTRTLRYSFLYSFIHLFRLFL